MREEVLFLFASSGRWRVALLFQINNLRVGHFRVSFLKQNITIQLSSKNTIWSSVACAFHFEQIVGAFDQL